MSQHKLSPKKRKALGLVGIRSVPRDATKAQRKKANWVARHPGWRRGKFEGKPGDPSPRGIMAERP
jgi:hypothetical protein